MTARNTAIEKTANHIIKADLSTEFEMINFNDKRLKKRFVKVAEDISKQPLAPINQACGTWADTKAAYRLFANEKVKQIRRYLFPINSAQKREQKAKK